MASITFTNTELKAVMDTLCENLSKIFVTGALYGAANPNITNTDITNKRKIIYY